MPFLAIVAVCVLAAVTYGIVHDQATARVCVEYFTIGHPPIFGTEDPTLLGLGWGVVATWWVGVMLGIPLAVFARAGSRPKCGVKEIAPLLLLLMALSAVSALVSGLIGAALARSGAVVLLEPLASKVPPAKHVAFLADLWAHNASYLSGFLGGGAVMMRVWYLRRKAADAKQDRLPSPG